MFTIPEKPYRALNYAKGGIQLRFLSANFNNSFLEREKKHLYSTEISQSLLLSFFLQYKLIKAIYDCHYFFVSLSVKN